MATVQNELTAVYVALVKSGSTDSYEVDPLVVANRDYTDTKAFSTQTLLQSDGGYFLQFARGEDVPANLNMTIPLSIQVEATGPDLCKVTPDGVQTCALLKDSTQAAVICRGGKIAQVVQVCPDTQGCGFDPDQGTADCYIWVDPPGPWG